MSTKEIDGHRKDSPSRDARATTSRAAPVLLSEGNRPAAGPAALDYSRHRVSWRPAQRRPARLELVLPTIDDLALRRLMADVERLVAMHGVESLVARARDRDLSGRHWHLDSLVHAYIEVRHGGAWAGEFTAYWTGRYQALSDAFDVDIGTPPPERRLPTGGPTAFLWGTSRTEDVDISSSELWDCFQRGVAAATGSPGLAIGNYGEESAEDQRRIDEERLARALQTVEQTEDDDGSPDAASDTEWFRKNFLDWIWSDRISLELTRGHHPRLTAVAGLIWGVPTDAFVDEAQLRDLGFDPEVEAPDRWDLDIEMM